MNKISTLSYLITLLSCISISVSAQCPASDITLSTQAAVTNFATTYPTCATIPDGVIITVEGPGITNLNGLSGLSAIDGQLEVQNCPDLTDITGLSNITIVNPQGEIEFEECNKLTSLHGLEQLTSCHDLEIKDCKRLMDITALSSLTTVSGELKIKNNPKLTSLDGLENVISVGCIDDDYQANGVFIYDNPLLEDCDAICILLNTPGAICGEIEIDDNKDNFPCEDKDDLIDQCLLALPVELASFKGYAMERSNMLVWQTESEENSLAFLVERSLDGVRNFTEIGRINAAGNSTAIINYEMEDENPVSLAYYRLRIVDFDGTFEYSDVIAVQRSKTEIDVVEVYPVPAEEDVTVLVHAKTSGKAIMTLSDFMGRKIKEEKVELIAGINHYTIDFDGHETNFYYLTIYNGNERIAKKILRASKD